MQDQMVERLCVALCALETPEEAHALLADLCTKRETSELAQRLEVAVMLRAGRSYVEVSRVTGASSTTVSRVSKCLNGRRAATAVLVLDRLACQDEGARPSCYCAPAFSLCPCHLLPWLFLPW